MRMRTGGRIERRLVNEGQGTHIGRQARHHTPLHHQL
jgi:hypothetical protein